LGAFDGFLEAAEELLEVVAALDEVDLGGVDHQEIGRSVAKEEVLIGAGNFFDVLRRDGDFVARGLFGDARPQNLRLGLEVDDEIRRGNVRGERFVVALVKLQFFVTKVEVREDAILFHEEVGKNGPRRLDGAGFAKAFLAFEQEVHLRPERRTRLFAVEIGEKRIVLAIEDAAGMEAFGEDARKRGFAYPQRPFDDNEARRLRRSLGNASAPGAGGILVWHRRDYSRVVQARIQTRIAQTRIAMDTKHESGAGICRLFWRNIALTLRQWTAGKVQKISTGSG